MKERLTEMRYLRRKNAKVECEITQLRLISPLLKKIYENSIFEAVKIKLNQFYVLFMHLINMIVNYLSRKYGIPLHGFFDNPL